MSKLLTLVRRELMEHRSGWMVAAVFGGLFVLGAVLGVFGLARVGLNDANITFDMLAEQAELDAVRPVLMVILVPIAMLFALVTNFVVFFYLLDSLYAERKDRSILFWKSLPVSDLQVVGAKYLTGLVAIPAMTVGVFIITALALWLIIGSAMTWAGAGAYMVHGPAALAQTTVVLVYTFLVMGLWFAPLHGWLLLVSAFAKRLTLGWAALPLVLAVVAERILFGTRHFLGWIAERSTGGLELAFSGDQHGGVMVSEGVMSTFPELATFLTPERVLAAPALWTGLVIGLVLLGGAVWLRRWRDES